MSSGDHLKLMTVVQLKIQLNYRDLFLSGNKAELIQRIKDHDKNASLIDLQQQMRIRNLQIGGNKFQLLERMYEHDKNTMKICKNKKRTRTLVIDLETSGLPKTRGNPDKYDLYDGCRIIEIGYIIFKGSQDIYKKIETLVKPEDFFIKKYILSWY